MDRPPVQALNVFLLKTGISPLKRALRDARGLVEHTLRQDLPFSGALFVGPPKRAAPTWRGFLQRGSVSDLGSLFNASTSAVLFVRASRRAFAFTFGYGRSLLCPTAFERAFGLRVVLNSVDPDKLASVDAKTIQELTILTRRQASRGSRLDAFSLDTDVELLRGVAGTPSDPNLARSVSGADSLHFREPIEVQGLARKCSSLLRAYRADDYKSAGFGFVDHVRTVTDPIVVDKLGDLLVAALGSRELDRVHLAPPEIIDQNRVDGFSYSKKGPCHDLDIGLFLDSLRRPDDLSVERLRRQRVFVHEDGRQEPTKWWAAFSAIVAELDHQGRRFVLSGGDWYEVDKSFVDRVIDRVRRIKSARLGLPTAHVGEHEKDYNQRASGNRGVYLCDRKCIRLNGSAIELCDLFTAQRQFVHVKRWDSSSTLSHLFAQGAVSAEIFVSDEGFRDSARKMLKSQSISLGKHIPKSRPAASSYEVVYAIIKKKTRDWRKALPFFSQLNLARAVERLSRLGFEPRIECIDIEQTDA